MRTLIVGVGALGGVVATRLKSCGAPVWLATRNPQVAAQLRESGLRVSGVAGELAVGVEDVLPLEEYGRHDRFDLIILATKAGDALAVAPRLMALLGAEGTLLTLQNGGVAQMLADRLLDRRILGGLSNLGATMTAPGVYEQRNAGHLLIGELAGGVSERAERVHEWLGRALEVRVSGNMRGAVWSKLALNCSVTTIGAIAGQSMRTYIAHPEGRDLFDRTYDEALSVALASGAQPEPMLVDPVPPGFKGRPGSLSARNAWVAQILRSYGDVKPSMLQDFERGRPTEIDFVNGYAVALGRQLSVETRANAAIVAMVHAITRRTCVPHLALLGEILRSLS